jgi:hypothetical protein
MSTHVEGANVPARDVIIKVREPELVVDCPAKIPRGVNATCSAKLDLPGSASFVVQNWSFAGIAGASANQAGDQKSWVFAPVESGRVTVQALVAGAIQTKSVQVEVVCNFLTGPTDDPILNSAAVQAEFRRLWAASNPDDPGPGRIERGSFVTEHNGIYRFIPYAGPSTRCTSAGGRVEVPAGHTLVGFIHTHPDNEGTIMPADGACRGNTQPDQTFEEGVSDLDRASARRLRDLLERHIPGYIIDPDNVHRFGHPSLGSRDFNRNGSC